MPMNVFFDQTLASSRIETEDGVWLSYAGIWVMA